MNAYLTAEHAVFALPEASLGTILNGDADTLDNVTIAIELATGRERIVPHYLTFIVPPMSPDGTVGLQLHEDDAYDLNGDRLAGDRTASILTLATGELTLARGSGPRMLQAAHGHYLYTVAESILGGDINSNGSAFDWLGAIAVIR